MDQDRTEPTLDRLVVERKTGRERFHANGSHLGFDLLSFWQWSTSDLVSNATRGRLAEYIVARALGLGGEGVRDEWAAYDLELADGTRVEVKSAAYLQSWFQSGYSRIMFLTPKTRGWDPQTNVFESEPRRQADVYVFALLAHRDKATVDPLNVTQWQFYVVPTAALDTRTRSQHSITLPSLHALTGGPVGYGGLRDAVRAAAAGRHDDRGQSVTPSMEP